MMDRERNMYSRLPGRSGTWFSLIAREHSRLWLAGDHVMHVLSSTYSERFRRFYFKDIQALVMCRTNSGRTINIVLSVLAGIFGVLSALFLVSPVSFVLAFPCAIIALSFLMSIGINVVLGPTCKCRLYTAVQTENLNCLGRVRTAQKVFDMVRPMILNVQGTIYHEDLDTNVDEVTDIYPSAGARTSRRSVTAPGKVQLREERGGIHLAVFIFVLVLGTTSYIDVYFQHFLKNLLDTLFMLATVILTVVALRRQRGSALPFGVRAATWTAMGAMVANFILWQVYWVVSGIANPGTMQNVNVIHEGPVFYGYCMATFTLFSVIALYGIISVTKFRLSLPTVVTPAVSDEDS